MNGAEKIVWEPLSDRHQKGKCSLGTVWIRTDRKGKAVAWYTIFLGKTRKWCSNGDPIELIRDLLNEELNQYLFIRSST